jgi:hypothetical protein
MKPSAGLKLPLNKELQKLSLLLDYVINMVMELKRILKKLIIGI